MTGNLGRYLFRNVDGTRLVKYPGLRVQWEWNEENGAFDAPQLFLSFSNHLGSTSAVIDYSDGTLVEWKTNYAYGADESHWKNSDPKYGNAEEPYGFTGKEEDQAVGLPVKAYSESLYGSVVYGKGPLFFHALRNKVSDKAFFEILRTYYDQYSYAIAYPQDFLAIAERVGGQELDDLYQEWIRGEN